MPPLEIELDFFDRDGKVVIPLPSNPLLIEVAAEAPALRPAANIAMTEIVDARELVEHKRLKLDVIATAHGSGRAASWAAVSAPICRRSHSGSSTTRTRPWACTMA